MQTEYTTFEDYWNWSVHNGSSVGAKQPINSVVFSGDLSKAKISIEGKIASANEGTEVLFYQKAGIGDGQQSANPWLQEMPDPLTKVTWDNYITMSPSEMEEKGYNMY